jgi:hypothetical protein
MWTTTGPKLLMTKIGATIGLLVSFVFVCEITVHSVLTSPENWAFVDHRGLSDPSQRKYIERTQCSGDFRSNVMQRDGPSCVVTQVAKDYCDVAHLIPWSKGDEVRFVISSYNYWMTLFSSTLQE